MKAIESLEPKLDELFVKNAPFQIPEKGRKAIVEWSPWVTLVLGLLSLLAARWLWSAAHTVNRLVDYANSLTTTVDIAPAQKLGVVFWLAFSAVVLSGVLMLASVPGLRRKSKSRGWDLAFLGVLANLVYGIVYVFAEQAGAVSRLLGTVISTVVGLYVLFQIRSYYSDEPAKTASPKDPPA